MNSKKKTDGYPSHLKYGDKKASSRDSVASLFANFFEQVYVSDETDQRDTPTFGVKKCVDLGKMSLTDDVILSALSKVDTYKGNGPDDISPSILRECAGNLVTSLSTIFNLSFSKRKYPTKWKASYLTPVFKSGSRSDVENYRGVAILPTFGKLFDSIVTDILTDVFKDKFSPRQHCFIKGRSTSTNLLEFTRQCIRAM